MARSRARPAELMPGTLRVISCRMDYLGDGAGQRGGRVTTRTRLHRALCARARLSQGAARPAAAARATASQAEVGPVRLSGLHRFGAGARGRARGAQAGIGWRGKHTLLLDRDAGSCFFLGEIYHRPAAARSTPTGTSTLRHAASACIDACPTRAIVGALRARRAPLHLVPHDRASRARSRKSCARSSATASTAATIASSPARGTGSRSASAEADFDAAQRPRPRHAVELFAWTRGRVRRAPRRQRDPAHRLRAVAAQPRRRPRQRAHFGARSSRRCVHARTIPRPWCASTCAGRCKA